MAENGEAEELQVERLRCGESGCVLWANHGGNWHDDGRMSFPMSAAEKVEHARNLAALAAPSPAAPQPQGDTVLARMVAAICEHEAAVALDGGSWTPGRPSAQSLALRLYHMVAAPQGPHGDATDEAAWQRQAVGLHRLLNDVKAESAAPQEPQGERVRDLLTSTDVEFLRSTAEVVGEWRPGGTSRWLVDIADRLEDALSDGTPTQGEPSGELDAPGS